MYTLLLDSSNIKLAVGLDKDNVLIDVICYDAWQRQSEYMINEIENLYKRNNILPKDISEIVTSYGPGSYTGIRIALTIAKVMAYALNCKLFLVSSLEILKDENKDSLCVMNARSKRSYVGIYGNGRVILNDCVMTNDDLLKLIQENKYVLCGDTEYLLLEGFESNILDVMLKIKQNIAPVDNILGVKPIYLKD
jgi:tRNA threonylcarbamoyladenosine biosynthesis protein TsaB